MGRKQIIRPNIFYEWVSGVLQNDMKSSDRQLYEYFRRKGKMTGNEATFYMLQRNNALKDFSYKLKQFEQVIYIIDGVGREFGTLDVGDFSIELSLDSNFFITKNALETTYQPNPT